jgi:CDP-diacylglycerol--glycerol-3-phosphate 3-phosphatidyltransferase
MDKALPWILTFARLPISAAFAVAAALAPAALGPGWAAGLLALMLAAEGTDALDGWAARRADAASELGGLADPLADSLGRLTMYFAAAQVGWIWLAVPLVMAGRDIIVAYVRVVVGRVGGKTSARVSGKVKAVVQGGALAFVVAAVAGWFGPAGPAMRHVASATVIVATAWSLVDYLRGGIPAAMELHRRR